MFRRLVVGRVGPHLPETLAPPEVVVPEADGVRLPRRGVLPWVSVRSQAPADTVPHGRSLVWKEGPLTRGEFKTDEKRPSLTTSYKMTGSQSIFY